MLLPTKGLSRPRFQSNTCCSHCSIHFWSFPTLHEIDAATSHDLQQHQQLLPAEDAILPCTGVRGSSPLGPGPYQNALLLVEQSLQGTMGTNVRHPFFISLQPTTNACNWGPPYKTNLPEGCSPQGKWSRDYLSSKQQ